MISRTNPAKTERHVAWLWILGQRYSSIRSHTPRHIIDDSDDYDQILKRRRQADKNHFPSDGAQFCIGTISGTAA